MRAHRNALLLGSTIVLAAAAVSCMSSQQQKPIAHTPGDLPSLPAQGVTPKLNATTFFAHGHLLERQGNFARAAENYRKALELQPDFVTARNRLGITLNQLGQHAEATAQFRIAVSAHPDMAYLYNNLGFSLYLEGKYPEAQTAFRRAVELKPEFARARMNLGLVLAHMERYDDALAEFRAATDEPNAYYNLAVVQGENGQYTAAVRSLDQALRLDPRFEAARQQLQSIAQIAAQQEAAEGGIAAAPSLTPAQPTTPAVAITPIEPTVSIAPAEPVALIEPAQAAPLTPTHSSANSTAAPFNTSDSLAAWATQPEAPAPAGSAPTAPAPITQSDKPISAAPIAQPVNGAIQSKNMEPVRNEPVGRAAENPFGSSAIQIRDVTPGAPSAPLQTIQFAPQQTPPTTLKAVQAADIQPVTLTPADDHAWLLRLDALLTRLLSDGECTPEMFNEIDTLLSQSRVSASK